MGFCLTCHQEVAIRPAGSGGFDQTVTFELAEHGVYVLWRLGPGIGDLLNARGDGPPVDAALVQHEVIGRPGPDIPLPEVGGRECFRLLVTMTCAPGLIAAASTWRSAGSESLSPSMRGSYPETRQSLTASFISWRRRSSLSGGMSGRFLLSARSISSRHRGTAR